MGATILSDYERGYRDGVLMSLDAQAESYRKGAEMVSKAFPGREAERMVGLLGDFAEAAEKGARKIRGEVT